jgi:hypothetical protein
MSVEGGFDRVGEVRDSDSRGGGSQEVIDVLGVDIERLMKSSVSVLRFASDFEGDDGERPPDSLR